MSEITYFTPEGLQKLKDEVAYLTSTARQDIARQIAEARDKGDLSENAEYDAAKNAQGLLELKISKLQNVLANARIIDESSIDNSKVLALCTVTIRNLANKSTMTYQLVSEKEADIKAGKISIKSPIAQGLLGKSVGDIAEVVAPNGAMKFEIIEISR